MAEYLVPLEAGHLGCLSEFGGYFRFIIIQTENAASHKYTAQTTGVVRAIPEIVGNSMLIPSQDSFNRFFFMRLKSAI